MTLTDACLLIADCPHTTARDEGVGFPLVRTPNVGFGRLEYEGMHRVSKDVYDIRNKRAVPMPGDLIYAREAPAGNVAVIEQGEMVCLGQRTVLLRPNPNIVDPYYLAYYLLLPEHRNELVGRASGATVLHVNLADIRSLKVEFPQLNIQKRIASVINDYYAAIANCRKQIALLEEAAMRLYREWFGDGKGENWREETAFDFCDIMSGGTPSTKHSEYYEGEIPFFTPADGHNVSCVLDTEKHLSSVGVSHCNSQLFPVGTIMVTARGTVGNVVYNAVPMAMNQSCYAIKPKDGCFSPLLLFVMLRNEMRQIQKAGSSGVFDAIKVETFKLLKLKVPNAELASHCLKVFRPMYSQVERLSRQICFLTEARNRLLPKLMKGEIAV